METESGQGDNVDDVGHERESGTARADRVDEIAAASKPHGQGAGRGPAGDGTAGSGPGHGAGTPTSADGSAADAEPVPGD